MDAKRKAYENRVRRFATRQGFLLSRSRTRDGRAIDHGRYLIVDPATDEVMTGGYLSLEQCEQWLTEAP